MRKKSSQKPLTIADIARRSGVAISTISRVLNDHPDVSTETKERVKNILAESQYRPNARARQLVQKTSRTVCFCLGNRSFLEQFHARILEGVSQYSREQNHNIAFVTYFYDPKTPSTQLSLPNLIWERGAVDGVIIAG